MGPTRNQDDNEHVEVEGEGTKGRQEDHDCTSYCTKGKPKSQSISIGTNGSMKRPPPIVQPSEISQTKQEQRSHPASYISETQQNILQWTRRCYIATRSEEEMIQFVILYGKRERGMMRTQHRKRIHFIQRKCAQHGMQLLTALSLRRHYMKCLNPNLNHELLGLGTIKQIRHAAEIFEQAIQGYLELHNIQFEDERAQKERCLRSNQALIATPDFLFCQPLNLQVNVPNGGGIVTRTIHWLEVKMFYGADTIEPDGKSAVGSILPKSQTYCKLFGPGAIVFLQGCGERLARALSQIGVMALDPDPQVDLEPLWAQMRTWCADADGNILP